MPAVAAECAGVRVVVDFASLGGGVQDRCASGDPTSGIAALRMTGFEPTRAAQQPGYFVCRIDGKPASDPCQRASPADAYWSYWHAKPGGTWRFSDTGAADYDPPPGSVEGWAFGDGKPPSVPPARAAASSPAAASASPAPSSADPRPVVSSARPGRSAPRTMSSPPSTPASPSPSALAAAPATSAAAPSTPASPVPSDAPTALPAGDDQAPGRGPLVALAVVLGLGAAAVVQARRRRSP